MIIKNDDPTRVAQVLLDGGIAMVGTDTIYGILACADNEKAVEKVDTVKQRNPAKQCIILLASASDAPTHAASIRALSEESDRPTSVIVPATGEPDWLLRGGTDIAYRVVRSAFLRDVIAITGPVIAPSANKEGSIPFTTVADAVAEFGEAIDCYVDSGTTPADTRASRIVRVASDGSVEIVRDK